MQINFKAKKLKEANAYVDLLKPPKSKQLEKEEKNSSFFQKLFKILFK